MVQKVTQTLAEVHIKVYLPLQKEIIEHVHTHPNIMETNHLTVVLRGLDLGLAVWHQINLVLKGHRAQLPIGHDQQVPKDQVLLNQNGRDLVHQFLIDQGLVHLHLRDLNQ